ncbi:MAG: hypothetical protein IKC79_03175, partial [Clostridia bacterium]|nr:hypothetical protein [Clostridia bacterium]
GECVIITQRTKGMRMELTIDKRKREINIVNHLRLSYWEMVYWQNYIHIPYDVREMDEYLRKKIQAELSKMYDMDYIQTIIDIVPENNSQLDRYYTGIVARAKASGDQAKYDTLVLDKIEQKARLAKVLSENIMGEYQHIVEVLKTTDYPDAYKLMLLKESMQKTYKIVMEDRKDKLLVGKRVPNKSISGMMNLPLEVVDIIYKNAEKHNNFGKLYEYAQKEYSKANLCIHNVVVSNAVGNGQWIRFDSKKRDPEHFQENVERLKILVADTLWCTNTMASIHLSEGDFYVYVDKDNEPHIAIKMLDDSIDEVRGLHNGNAQEIEPEYLDVVVEFLGNNQHIKNGVEWLNKHEWNKRLIGYASKIDSGETSDIDIGKMLSDITMVDYRGQNKKNSNLVYLINNIGKLKNELAKYYGYRENEVYVGEWRVGWEGMDREIKMVIGKVIFSPTDKEWGMPMSERLEYRKNIHQQFSTVERVIGELDMNLAEIDEFTNLREVYGTLKCGGKLRKLGSLTKVYGNIVLNFSKVEDLGELNYISGDLYADNTIFESMGKIREIGGDCTLLKAKLMDMANVERIGNNLNLAVSRLKTLKNLRYIGGWMNAIHCELADLGELRMVGKNVELGGSKITSLNKLSEVGGNIVAGNMLQSLGDLRVVGKKLDISKTQINTIGNSIKLG